MTKILLRFNTYLRVGPLNLLLDTHILLWSLHEPEKLPKALADSLQSQENDIWFSSISVWEVAIKTQLGRLQMPGEWLTGVIAQEFKPMPFEMRHAHMISKLPLHHRDPFDRALLAQAISEGFTLVSMDARMRLYRQVVNLLHG